MDTEKKKKASYRKPKSGALLAGEKPLVEFQNTGGLVGSIVEKGFSSISSSSSNPAKPSLISYPQPTVLPFPVARHRSHGPHWNPLHGALEPEDEELVEDMDQTDYAPLSFSASPIERKQKKGMDFSRWRDFVPSGDSAASQLESKGSKPAEEKRKILATTAAPDSGKEFTELQQGELDSALSVKKVRVGSFLGRHVGAAVRELSKGNEATEPVVSVGREFDHVREEKMMTSYDGQVFESTMDDIHVENLARLTQMSAEEITEAQTEIIEKMKPAIIDMLKRRGSKKLRSKDTTVQDQKKAGHDVVPGRLINIDNSESDNVLNRLPAKHVKTSETSVPSGNWMPEGQSKSSFWKIWSERVEKVRNLRFSLEGNIVEVDWGQVSNGYNPEVGHPSVDNVAERDFLRTDGEPAALGYSIKEAVALMRSMVPAQRALALKLLNTILNKALFNFMNGKVGHEGKGDTDSNDVDWQAIWAYALGPEPQLVLSLRIALDDNHDSVVLACAKVIRCILSCDLNENFFNVAEKVPTIQKVLCTAPVFRSRPEVDDGFLHGGFWKYNTKPSNILPSNVDSRDDEHEENHTIQDDVVVAGQDIAAGLVRMGLLPRICYLLEMEPVPTLVECLVSVLIGLARHSLVCANAIIQCSSVIQSLVSILTRQGMMEIQCQTKAITLLKVLCQMDKRFCSNFVKGGIFQKVMWHWYRSPLSVDEWVQYGKEYCKLMASLMIEQLRLWKVCMGYGYCLACFSDFFPHMCLWLSRPKFDKLLQFDVLDEFSWITREAYHTLAALAEWLPCLHSVYQQKMADINLDQDGMEIWSWGNVVPMVDLAISWLSVKDIPYISFFTHNFEESHHYQHGHFKESVLNNLSSLSSMIWVVSAVMHMLSSIFHRISPKNAHYGDNPTVLPWLPQFVPKVGIELVKNGILSFSGLGNSVPKASSLSEGLCYLRHHGNLDVSLSSTSCLLGLVRLASLVDKCIQGARNGCDFQHLMRSGSSEIQERILAEGMTKWAKEDLTKVLDAFGNLVCCEWQVVQSVESFGRGGPAPGVGLGWGSAGGGFWSLNVLQAQTDAHLVLKLFGVLPILHEEDLASAEVLNSAVVKSSDAMMLALQRVNFVLSVCLVAGPGDKGVVEDALCILLQPIVLKYLGLCLHHFLMHDSKFRTFKWQYEEQDYVLIGKILKSHFIERWLSTKKKTSGDVDGHNKGHSLSRKTDVLETIYEGQEDQETPDVPYKFTECSSFYMPWAHQRLPIPIHWFLSAVCSIGDPKNSLVLPSKELLELAKSGLFLLLCLEALSIFLFSADTESPIFNVPLAWKFHALSMSLRVNMVALEDNGTREIFESLQELYGKQLDDLRCKQKKQELEDSLKSLSKTNQNADGLLCFQSQIFDGYSTFVEDLIEQFGSVSYGDIIFARQVAIYLHHSVDIPVRLAAWNSLSNNHLLELLPPLETCLAQAEGYLEPPEENEGILEAYTKSWTSGCLDRAYTRGSIAFILALHHLNSFVFKSESLEKLKLRNKLTKALLRSYSHKQQSDGMLIELVQYKLPPLQDPLRPLELKRRLVALNEACEGNSSLLAVIDNLKSALER